MTSSFKITEYLDILNYPERFGKAIFFGHTIIIDTWTGLINATHFCKQFDSKKFCHFLEDDFERSDIIHFYDTITPLNDNWKDIYNIRENFLIIDANTEEMKEIRGTYVHYKSFIKVGVWCDYKLKLDFYKLLIELSNLYNIQRVSNEETKIQDMTNFLSIVREDHEKVKWEIAAYKSLLPLYGKEKIQERINALPDSNKNKAKYQDLFNKGNFKKLPKCVLYG